LTPLNQPLDVDDSLFEFSAFFSECLGRQNGSLTGQFLVRLAQVGPILFDFFLELIAVLGDLVPDILDRAGITENGLYVQNRDGNSDGDDFGGGFFFAGSACCANAGAAKIMIPKSTARSDFKAWVNGIS
jgi:hypothetical protein